MHIHFIGICGVAMSALAFAFHNDGHTITGSDKGFFPPVSTALNDAGISYYPGWHPEKMIANGQPDLVIVGNVASSTNPEWLYVQEHEITYLSYPEAIAKFFVKDISIVAAGTYGKTTSTTLLSWIFLQAKQDPSYMFGGLLTNNTPSARLGKGTVSILEGDEYKSARWDMRPKFAHYAPTHLLLTAVEWDHADIYPTEKIYFDTFSHLVQSIPDTGLIVADTDQAGVSRILDTAPKATVIRYGKTDQDYTFSKITQTREGLSFTIHHKDNPYAIQTSLLGVHNVRNITGCFAMAHQRGIAPEHIAQAIASFPGIKRRLELRLNGDIIVIDDIAHSPAKAASALKTVASITKGKVIALFEPNTGNRQAEAIPQYDHAFKDADIVYIPRLSRVKQDPTKPAHLDGQALAHVIAATHPDVQHIDDDDTLTKTLVDTVQPGDTIIFLGSHGFRGMIDVVAHRLSI